VAAASVVAFAILTLVGCARLQFRSEFREDGSATHTVLLLFERAELDQAAAPAVEQSLADARAQAVADGFDVEAIDTERELGARVTDVVLDAEDTGAALNSLFNSIGGGPDSAPIAPFQGTFGAESGAVGGAVFELELIVDGDLLLASIGQVAPSEQRFPQARNIEETLTVEFIAVMPGEIKETNGTLLGEDTVRWQLPFNSISTLSATSKVGKEGSTAWFVVAAAVSAVAAAALAALVGLILQRRRRQFRSALATAPTAPAAPLPAAATVAEPETLAEVGSTLVRIVGQVVGGSPETAEEDRQPADADEQDDAPPGER
jgi:hypothetical protein